MTALEEEKIQEPSLPDLDLDKIDINECRPSFNQSLGFDEPSILKIRENYIDNIDVDDLMIKPTNIKESQIVDQYESE